MIYWPTFRGLDINRLYGQITYFCFCSCPDYSRACTTRIRNKEFPRISETVRENCIQTDWTRAWFAYYTWYFEFRHFKRGYIRKLPSRVWLAVQTDYGLIIIYHLHVWSRDRLCPRGLIYHRFMFPNDITTWSIYCLIVDCPLGDSAIVILIIELIGFICKQLDRCLFMTVVV